MSKVSGRQRMDKVIGLWAIVRNELCHNDEKKSGYFMRTFGSLLQSVKVAKEKREVYPILVFNCSKETKVAFFDPFLEMLGNQFIEIQSIDDCDKSIEHDPLMCLIEVKECGGKLSNLIRWMDKRRFTTFIIVTESKGVVNQCLDQRAKRKIVVF